MIQPLAAQTMHTKEERERLVFERFGTTVGLLPGGAFESRPTPEPDILYSPESGAPRAFELVEILDQDFSATVGQQLGTKDACLAYLEGLPTAESNAFRAQYGNAHIFLGFHDRLTIQRRKKALPEIFAALTGLPPGFTGDAFDDGGPLQDLVDRISVDRGRLRGPLFDVPGVTWVGDPTVDAISGKMAKYYEPQGELSLLAYIDGNPMFPDEVWLPRLDTYLATLGRNCQFAHIYVFDCRTSRVYRKWSRTSP
ncbi:hypothetical protein [Roseateles puraquae]|uniref:Uncharacterized protein n=1 Tax=Roseateles puraquae TaxID=431059 RepID=A0A254N4E7_9BURK|nr:hypothetical protein [Roseateles puraquae]MDG0853384.1 hypothetical protein [Roseateles puraquae]OWR02961.1 hypothetical protein CDO81_15360 [Roseateles puraquae]